MTVVISKEVFHRSFKKDCRCTLCGKPASVPFVYWHGDREIIFCNECCDDGLTGLRADIIQTKAIVEIQRLYPQCTLQHRLTTEVDAEEKRKNSDDEIPF